MAKMQKVQAPVLGLARLRLEISDKNGFVIRHGMTGEVLARKAPERCSDEWERMWSLFAEMGIERIKKGDEK